MNSPNKYSIYPNLWARIGLHLLLWLLLYIFTMIICKGTFAIGMLTTPVLLYSLILSFVVICNHYFLSYITLPFLEKREWLWTVPLQLVMVYIFSVTVIILSIAFIAKSFPEYPTLKLQSERYYLYNFANIFNYKSFSWFISFTLFFNILSFLLKFAKNYYETNQDKISLIKEKNQMELNFLRSQIQPHFLFNTLNNIYGLVIENQKASQSIIKLSDLLRFSLYESSQGEISLQREISFLTDYIILEQIRHKDDRVSIEFDFDNIEEKSIKIKPLLLVNFIENAFKHGVNANINYSWVKIILTSKKNVVHFTIENNKPQKKHPVKQETGVGLRNVRRRLELEYPERYDLSIKETSEVYEVKLTLRINE